MGCKRRLTFHQQYVQTALLRQVLTEEKFNVLHFDLRIAGFADLSSLYISLSEQMEQYFLNISTEMQGYEEFEKEAWRFKVCFPGLRYPNPPLGSTLLFLFSTTASMSNAA